MQLRNVLTLIADTLKEFDTLKPVCKTKKRTFKPGIGPFGEPLLLKNVKELLTKRNYSCKIAQHPDLMIGSWAIEVKIVRPFGDNDKEAENWSVNLLHPYKGNTSAIGDALKLISVQTDAKKAIFVIGYEHQPAKISLDPLLESFELIAKSVCKIQLGPRLEERRDKLVHPYHQVVRCITWEVVND
jgi:hypothetical protein